METKLAWPSLSYQPPDPFRTKNDAILPASPLRAVLRWSPMMPSTSAEQELFRTVMPVRRVPPFWRYSGSLEEARIFGSSRIRS